MNFTAPPTPRVIHARSYWRVLAAEDQFRFETLTGQDLTLNRYTLEAMCQDLAAEVWGPESTWNQLGPFFAGRASARCAWKFWVIDHVDFTGRPVMRSLTFRELQGLAQQLGALLAQEA